MKNSFPFSSLITGFLTSSLLTLAVTGCACSDNRKPKVEQKNQNENPNDVAMVESVSAAPIVIQAAAQVKGVGEHQVSGTITFTKIDDGIEIVADVSGLKPGKHGFHAHEHGDCGGKDGMAAGGHFNPTNSKHGGPDSPERHVGDFGNLEADEEGKAHYVRVDKLIAFEGPNSILGKSIIIHADADDFVTQPTGNSGPRIGCGLIESVQISSGN